MTRSQDLRLALLLTLDMLVGACALGGEVVLRTWSASPQGDHPAAVKIAGQ